jgi:hypothetical protein
MSKFKQGEAKPMDLLEELILQGVMESGKVPILDEDGGFEEIEVASAAVELTVPSNCGSATIMVEADLTTGNLSKAIRFTENDTPPTDSFGFVLGDGDFYEVSGDILSTFSMISKEAEKTHKVFVQYYKSIKTS